MASADVQRRLLRTGQGVLTPAEGLAALRWVLGANARGAEPQVSCKRMSCILVWLSFISRPHRVECSWQARVEKQISQLTANMQKVSYYSRCEVFIAHAD